MGKGRISKTVNGRRKGGGRAMPAASPARVTGAETRKMVRKRSRVRFWGLPLWEIARGQDLVNGERHGHARAIIAIGDLADGVIAVGGIARGVISIGGLAAGVIAVGGVSVGLVAALGGIAAAPLAIGGAALGVAAFGGAAVGVYGRGRRTAGPHVTHSDAHHRRTPRHRHRLRSFATKLLRPRG